MRIGWMLVGVIVADAVGNMLLSRGMKQGKVPNPTLAAGVLCMAFAFSLFLTLLSRADLSFVLPITSLGYGANAFCARYLLKERVLPSRWMGTAFICVGVALVSFSSIGH